MNRTVSIMWILCIVICCLLSASSVSSETTKPAFCMTCKSGCKKYGQSEVLEPLILQANLDLNAEIDATAKNVKAGNNEEIQKTIDLTGIAFTVVGRAAGILANNSGSDAMEEALKEIKDKLNSLNEVIEEMTNLLQLRTIYNDYMPDRLAIRTQLDKLDEFRRRSTLDKLNGSKQNFLNSYQENGGDIHLHRIYYQTRSIISRASTVTQNFRRIVADFGNDLIMHVAAGVATYYAYGYYNDQDTRVILDEWSTKLASLQNIVTEAEKQCMAKSTQAGLDNYLWTIKDHGECPYSTNEERAKSTFTALTDKYDWLMWSVTCYDTPHGENSHEQDEISGPQFTRIGDDNFQVRGIYMNRGDIDITDDENVWDSMAGQKKLNCDQVHSRLKSAGGTVLCAENQLHVYNSREGNLGFHEFVGGKDIDVWVTWVNWRSGASRFTPQHTIEL